METPPRLVPLLEQFDFASQRLRDRLAGPMLDSGDGEPVEIASLTDDEYRWEPVGNCLSIRRAGAGLAAEDQVGAGDWRRDRRPVDVSAPRFTTIAWRLSHLSEMLLLRADHLVGSHQLTLEDYRYSGDAVGAIAAFDTATAAWRSVLAGADDVALDEVGRSTYPYGSDPEVPLLETVWWVNQELLHHGAEIALLRDLYGARQA